MVFDCFAPGGADMAWMAAGAIALLAGWCAARGACAPVAACWVACLAPLRAAPPKAESPKLARRPRRRPGRTERFRRGLSCLCALLCAAALASYASSSRRLRPPLVERSTGKAERAACACASVGCLRRALGAGRRGALSGRGGAVFKPPHFWLGGCQKCGTTSLYDLLARHPQIVAPTPKEPGFFAYPSFARTWYDKWYARDVLRLPELCGRGLAHSATFDATAYYLQWGGPVARALKAAAPWARAVVIFREPVARAISWLQHMALKFPNVPNCLHYRPLDCCVAKKWFLQGGHHLGGSRYHAHLASWLDNGWVLDEFHVVRFEDLFERDGLATLYAGILEFLDLDVAPARNLSKAESKPSNRRSVAPYNVSAANYDAMVAAVADDTARLEALLGRDFGWTRTWDAQRAQCARDGVCRVSLIPPKARRR